MSADIQKSGGIYYGWVVYVAVCVCMFLACAFTFNTASHQRDPIKGTIVLNDDSLHNPDYHELKNAEGEALRLCGASA